MIKKIALWSILGVLAVSLAGCQNMNKQEVGVIAGGAVGGLLGSQFGGGNGKVLAAVGGAVAGAALGGLIGHYMDKTDRLEMNQALENNKNNQATRWRNPNTGDSYSVKPTKTYYKNNGTPCREYYFTANIGGKPKQIYGTACRQADGSWKAVK